MFFKQLQKKLLFLTRNKIHQKNKKFTPPRINFDKEESEGLALEKINNLILKRKFKKGLNLVNTTIESGITSQQLLAKKAFLLSQNKQYDEAHSIWEKLSKNKNKPKLAESAKKSLEASKKEASQLLSKNLAQKALNISSTKSPKEAISYFIEEHLKLSLYPTLNNEVKTILEKIEPSKNDLSNVDLKKHQLQLTFNTQVIKCIEARLHDQGRLSAITPTQKSGSNLKTVPKDG